MEEKQDKNEILALDSDKSECTDLGQKTPADQKCDESKEKNSHWDSIVDFF